MAGLPEELLQHVCSYLCGLRSESNNLNLATLASLSLSSKACNQAARSSLYFALDIRNDRASRLRQFLATIIQQQITATFVRELRTDEFETERYVDRGITEPAPLSVDVLARFQASVDALPVSSELKARLKSGLEKGVQDAELALLICLCPNLRVWQTVAVNRFDQTMCLAVVREALGSDRSAETMPLQQLREAVVSHWDTKGAARIPKLQSLLELPALETFRGHMLVCDESNPLSTSKPLKLRRAYLNESLLDGIGLEGLLSACTCLETLYVQWGGSTVGVSNVDYISIGLALQRHAKKLKNLTLRPEEAFLTGNSPGPLGDLKALESLHMLSVPSDALFRDNSEDRLINRLPVALRTLRINGADDDEAKSLDSQLFELLADGRFTNLSTIRINRREQFSRHVDEIGWDVSESNSFWVVLKKVH